jgi:hypothetical protein
MDDSSSSTLSDSPSSFPNRDVELRPMPTEETTETDSNLSSDQDEDDDDMHNSRRYPSVEELEDASFRELPHPIEAEKTLGARLNLGRYGPLFFAIAVMVPYIFIFTLYGAIPLGDPHVDVFEEEGAWPMVLLINPTVFMVVGYLIVVTFFGCIEEKRPFFTYWPIVIATYVVEVIVMTPLALAFGFFRGFGAVCVFVCYATVFVGLIIHQRSKMYRTSDDFKKLLQYAKVLVAIFVHIVFLCGYVIAYRYVPSEAQPVLTFILTLATFIFRKILLSLTDVFPLEMAMLIASFWIENMADVFYTLAYPSVRDPWVYAYIFVINFFSNAANLLFLTSWWFTFRVWIKGVLTCKCKRMPSRNDLELYDERGHSNNRPGYNRRQTRFYFWKIFSQLLAIIFYLGISALLRYGPNRRYYPLGTDPIVDVYTGQQRIALSADDYRNSLIYCGANFVVLVLAGIFGFLLVRFCYTSTFETLWKIQGHLILRNRVYIGYVVVIIAHNGLIAVMMIQYHAKIWWAFGLGF